MIGYNYCITHELSLKKCQFNCSPMRSIRERLKLECWEIYQTTEDLPDLEINVVDVSCFFQKPKKLGTDGVHPTDDGVECLVNTSEISVILALNRMIPILQLDRRFLRSRIDALLLYAKCSSVSAKNCYNLVALQMFSIAKRLFVCGDIEANPGPQITYRKNLDTVKVSKKNWSILIFKAYVRSIPK